MIKYVFFLLAVVSSVYGGSIRLHNDSPYKLRVIIRGADGTYLGEMILNPSHGTTWADSYGQVGQFGKGTLYQEGTTRSQTPYSVHWYCLEGSPYSYSDIVATGSTVTARGGDGARICKPKEDKSGPYPQNQQGELLAPNAEGRSQDLHPSDTPIYRYPEEETPSP